MLIALYVNEQNSNSAHSGSGIQLGDRVIRKSVVVHANTGEPDQRSAYLRCFKVFCLSVFDMSVRGRGDSGAYGVRECVQTKTHKTLKQRQYQRRCIVIDCGDVVYMSCAR